MSEPAKNISVRLSAEAKDTLGLLSRALHRPEKDLAGQAIQDFFLRHKGELEHNLSESFRSEKKTLKKLMQ